MNERPIRTSPLDAASSTEAPLGGFARVPGFIRRWELPQVIHPGVEFVIEDAGKLDGVDVFRVFQRLPKQDVVADDNGIAVSVTFEGDATPLPARILPISAGRPLMAVLVLDGDPREAALLARVREHLATAVPLSSPASSQYVADAHTPGGAR